MSPVTPSGNPSPMLPADLRERLERAHLEMDREPAARAGRLPVWVAAACLGAGLLIAPSCGGKKDKEPAPPPGLETALKKPAEMAMEPELESQDPMDPVPGQIEPPPGSMIPLPPPTRGADKPEDPLAGVPGDQPGSRDVRAITHIGSFGSGLYGAPFPSSRRKNGDLREGIAQVTGKIDPNEIRAVIRAHRNEVHHCYQKGLLQNDRLEGEVRVTFELNSAGRASSCTVVQNLAVPVVGESICERLKTWRFPQPERGVAKVTYSWTMTPPEKDTQAAPAPAVP